MPIYRESPEGIILSELPELLASDNPHDNRGAAVCADYLGSYYGDSADLDSIRNSAEKMIEHNDIREIIDTKAANPVKTAYLRFQTRIHRYRRLEQPRIIGMFAAAAFTATTEGLQDKHYVERSLSAAHKSASNVRARDYLSTKLNIPFCEYWVSRRAAKKTVTAFAIEPFVYLDEQLNKPLGETRISKYRREHKRLVEQCQDRLDKEKFARKTTTD